MIDRPAHPCACGCSTPVNRLRPNGPWVHFRKGHWAKIHSKRVDPIKRFFSHFTQADGCWLWTGSISLGYGRVWWGDRKTWAHRVAWEIANGQPVPPGLLVCHHCDVRNCVNPAHLFIGTHGDNTHDMDAKGRRRCTPVFGEQHKRAKLNTQAVRSIRAARARGERLRVIAARHGISVQHASLICLRNSWKHLDPLTSAMTATSEGRN